MVGICIRFLAQASSFSNLRRVASTLRHLPDGMTTMPDLEHLRANGLLANSSTARINFFLCSRSRKP